MQSDDCDKARMAFKGKERTLKALRAISYIFRHERRCILIRGSDLLGTVGAH